MKSTMVPAPKNTLYIPSQIFHYIKNNTKEAKEKFPEICCFFDRFILKENSLLQGKMVFYDDKGQMKIIEVGNDI